MKIKIVYDASEFEEGIFSSDDSPSIAMCRGINIEHLTKVITEEFKTDSFKFVKEKISIDKVFQIFTTHDDNFRVECIDVGRNGSGRNATLVFKVKLKDRIGEFIPRLIPHDDNWFLIFADIAYAPIKIGEMKDIAGALCKMLDNNRGFNYMAILNSKLEIIDWDPFWDYHSDESKKTVNANRGLIRQNFAGFVKEV
jgi:hypothetical protein